MAVTVAENNPPAFVDAAIRFLLQCNAVQVRFDPKKCMSPSSNLPLSIYNPYLVRFVCHKLTEIAVEQRICIRVLQALKAAIWKIGGEGHVCSVLYL